MSESTRVVPLIIVVETPVLPFLRFFFRLVVGRPIQEKLAAVSLLLCCPRTQDVVSLCEVMQIQIYEPIAEFKTSDRIERNISDQRSVGEETRPKRKQDAAEAKN